MNIRRFTAIGVFLAIPGVIAGGLYLRGLRGDLDTTHHQFAAATAQAQSLKERLSAAEKARDDAVAAREVLEAKLAERAGAQSTGTVPEDETTRELAAAEVELARARAELRDARQVAGYWRQLFDYTRASRSQTTAAGAAETRQSASVKTDGSTLN